MAWTYSDWRGQSGASAQRARLILHIQEVADQMSGWQAQGAIGLSGARFQLQQYYDSLVKELRHYDEALGLDFGADVEPFVQLKPLLDDDNMVIDE